MAMDVTLRQLRAYVAVLESASFSEAAKAMHLSQAALSGLIKELESRVGIRLLDRTTRKVSASAVGETFAPMARRVLSEWSGKSALSRWGSRPTSQHSHSARERGDRRTIPLPRPSSRSPARRQPLSPWPDARSCAVRRSSTRTPRWRAGWSEQRSGCASGRRPPKAGSRLCRRRRFRAADDACSASSRGALSCWGCCTAVL